MKEGREKGGREEEGREKEGREGPCMDGTDARQRFCGNINHISVLFSHWAARRFVAGKTEGKRGRRRRRRWRRR